MKKLLIGAAMIMSFAGFSQSRYFSFSAGYGLGFPGNSEYESDYSGDPNGDMVITNRVRNINLGGGLNVNLAYGLPISENLNLDLGLGYQNNFGSETEGSDYSNEFTNTYNSWSTKFTPSVRFQGDCDKIVPFGQIGPQLMLASVSQTFARKSTINGSALKETKNAPTLSVGAFAALGAEMEVSENVWFFATLSANLGYYSPRRSEVVAYEENGVDMLDQPTVREREREYEKEVTYTNTPVNVDEPSKGARTRVDDSAVSLNLGIRVVL